MSREYALYHVNNNHAAIKGQEHVYRDNLVYSRDK